MMLNRFVSALWWLLRSILVTAAAMYIMDRLTSYPLVVKSDRGYSGKEHRTYIITGGETNVGHGQ